MPTAVEIKNKSNTDIRNKTLPESISNVDHADINDLLVDYVDQEVEKLGTEVVLQISRESVGGTYTVTEVKNDTGLTFTASDSGSAITQITASGNFFVNNKVKAQLSIVRNSGNPYITYENGNGYTSPTIRGIYFYNIQSSGEARPASFTITVSYTVYP